MSAQWSFLHIWPTETTCKADFYRIEDFGQKLTSLHGFQFHVFSDLKYIYYVGILFLNIIVSSGFKLKTNNEVIPY